MSVRCDVSTMKPYYLYSSAVEGLLSPSYEGYLGRILGSLHQSRLDPGRTNTGSWCDPKPGWRLDFSPTEILQPKTRGGHSHFTDMCKLYISHNLCIMVFFETFPDNCTGTLVSEINTDLRLKQNLALKGKVWKLLVRKGGNVLSNVFHEYEIIKISFREKLTFFFI